jgi:hypothetical protein
MNAKIQSLCSGVVLVSALCAFSAPRAPLAAQSESASKSEPVKFKRVSVKPGDTITSKIDVDGSLTVAMSVKGEVVQHFDQVNKERTHKKTVVLAVGDDGPTKVSVHYDDVVDIQQGSDDPDAKTTSPIAGKTFVLEKTSKGITITDEDGTVVGDDLGALVREKELSHGESLEHGFDRIASLVAEHSRKIGEKFQVPEEIALEIAGADEDLKDGRMSLSLRELREIDGVSCGVFAAEVRLSGTAGADEYKTSIELQGEIAIRIEGARFVSAELSGRVTVDGAVTTEDTTVTVSGEGPLKIVETATYGHEAHEDR